MAEVKWIKITTDIFSDEKVMLIEQMPEADTMLVIWFKLLCMAGKENNYGVFLMRNRMPYTEEMLATIFRRPLNTVRLALSTFEAFGMIEIEDDIISIPNWEKHQNIDGMERIREQTRKRVADYRERQKKIACNVTVTQRNATEEEKNREEKKKKEEKSKKETTTQIFDRIIHLYPFPTQLVEKMRDWMEYKEEKKDSYTERVMVALLNRVQRESEKYGANPVMQLVDESMENNWKGIIWDRLVKEQKQSKKNDFDEWGQMLNDERGRYQAFNDD